MKNYKKLYQLTILGLIISMSLTLQAQQKEVTVKIISDEGTVTVDNDTVKIEDVQIYHIDGKSEGINIDSIVAEHTKDIDKKMKVMAFKLDSLAEMNFNFDFDFDLDMEKLHIQMERLMKDRGIDIKELESLKEGFPHKMIFIGEGEGDHTVDIESHIDDQGKHVKVIRKQIVSPGEEDDQAAYVIKSIKNGEPVNWSSSSSVKVEPIPMDEISFLKKLGVSGKQILNDPLEVNAFKVKFEKNIKNELKEIILHIECILPGNGKYEMELINRTGEVSSEDSKVPSGELKKSFDLNEDKAPYYFILSKNNQLFGRKISL